MKASGSISETGISGEISGSKGGVGITPAGIELALNAGVGQLGISTDYGGGVVIGIGGQKIVWGREGGTIHYNLFGLELIVEARDCIVVETRKIGGQIIDSHTYPDPGCKPPTPTPTPGSSPPIEVPGLPPPMPPPMPGGQYLPLATPPRRKIPILPDDGGKRCYYIIDYTLETYDFRYYHQKEKIPHVGRFVTATRGSFYIANGIVANTEQYTERNEWSNYPIADHVRKNLSYERPGYVYFSTTSEMNARMASTGYNDYQTQYWQGTDADPGYHWFATTYYILESYATKVYCPGEPPKTPSAGNRPPMPQDCCKELAADLADLKEVLATKEMLKEELTFPWRLRMPGGQGEEVIKNYPNLARAMVQVIDHLGIHPPKLNIKDINNAIAGDQSISNQFPCATQGFEALMAQVWDANADVDTLTNFLYRLSWLCVQQSMNLAVVSADIQSIKDMIGGKTTPDKATITTPFNIGAGVKEPRTRGKGFGKNKSGEINKKIDANTELSTESLLPDFLKIRDNDIIIERYTGDRDVVDMLSLILLKLETLSAR